MDKDKMDGNLPQSIRTATRRTPWIYERKDCKICSFYEPYSVISYVKGIADYQDVMGICRHPVPTAKCRWVLRVKSPYYGRPLKCKNCKTKHTLMDSEQVIGISMFKLKDRSEWKISNVNLSKLEKVVKMLRALEKNKSFNVDICVADNSPIVFGKFDRETNSIGGIALAHCIVSED
jgi:hypothetical protein